MIEVIQGGLFDELTYLYIDDKTNHGFIIDPGAEASHIISHVTKKGYTIEKILITHGHLDHIRSAEAVREALKAPIVIHKEGKIYLEDVDWNLSQSIMCKAISFSADEYVEHGDEIALNANPDFKVRVIYAPGHTADGVAYYSEKEGVAFVGDIIFEGCEGRSDLPGGNRMRLLSSIRAQIFTLPDETIILAGHGNETTVGREKRNNPSFNFFD